MSLLARMASFSVEVPSLRNILCVLWMFLLMCVAICAGETHHHGRRNLIQLGNMMMCATGRFPSDYIDYGCFCGPGGDMKHAAIDETDQCCRDHDRCFDDLVRRCPPYLLGLIPFPYIATYRYTYDSCMSVFSTTWVHVSPGVSKAPESAEKVKIQCGEKQYGDEKTALCRRQLCDCNKNFALCLGRSNYEVRHRAIHVENTCKPAVPSQNASPTGQNKTQLSNP
ncbi:basic phospholipase A2 KBf-VA-like [Branchiostoma floridae x Branchiostoma belcheri]